MPWARLWGTVSQGHMNSARWAAAYRIACVHIFGPGLGRKVTGHELERPGERPGAGRLHRVHAGHAGKGAQGHGLGQALRHRTCERAAADLDHDVIEASLAGERGSHLVTESLSAFDGQPVLVPLAGERQGTVGDRRLQAVIGRVAGDAGRTRAHRDLSSERPQPVQHRRLGVGGHEDQETPLAGGRDDRCCQGGIAAARDCERRERVLRSCPAPGPPRDG